MTRSLCRVLLCCALLPASLAVAKKPSKTVPADEVQLFEAVKKKQIGVLIVPRNARRLTMTIRNLTNKPLRIQVPAALAAVPIQRQIGGFNGGGLNGGGGGGGFNGGGDLDMRKAKSFSDGGTSPGEVT